MDTSKTNSSMKSSEELRDWVFSDEPPKKHDEKNEEHSLKGTAASLAILAVCMVAMWGAVFWLYMSRV